MSEEPPKVEEDGCYHDADYPKTLEEELSEILEAFYTIVSEEEIRKYQEYSEGLQHKRISQGAVQAPSMAPDFELTDQDGETVNLKELLEHGPVVVVFYRGKWCPQCNATIMRFQRHLEEIQAKGATLVAISPMLPDGTQVFSTKRSLKFPVLSDVGNAVARKFKITFTIPEEIRPNFLEWGEDVPAHNGDDSWEIPLPATYVISQKGEIIWSFVDDDSTVRAELTDIVAALPDVKEEEAAAVTEEMPQCKRSKDDSPSTTCIRGGNKARKMGSSVKQSFTTLFGKKKQEPGKFLSHYMCPG